MPIFGDLSEHRIIPLIFVGGIIILALVYLVYLYKWLRFMFSRRNSFQPPRSEADVSIVMVNLEHSRSSVAEKGNNINSLS